MWRAAASIEPLAGSWWRSVPLWPLSFPRRLIVLVVAAVILSWWRWSLVVIILLRRTATIETEHLHCFVAVLRCCHLATTGFMSKTRRESLRGTTALIRLTITIIRSSTKCWRLRSIALCDAFETFLNFASTFCQVLVEGLPFFLGVCTGVAIMCLMFRPVAFTLPGCRSDSLE